MVTMAIAGEIHPSRGLFGRVQGKIGTMARKMLTIKARLGKNSAWRDGVRKKFLIGHGVAVSFLGWTGRFFLYLVVNMGVILLTRFLFFRT